MTKLLAVLTICALVAIVSSFGLKYDMTVVLGSQQFEKVNATFKVAIKSPNTERVTEFKWRAAYPLAPNTNHSNSVTYDYQIGQIKNMTFVFNVTNPSDRLRNPVVFLKHLKLEPTYYPPGRFRLVNTKYYCPRTPSTPHGVEVPLALCN